VDDSEHFFDLDVVVAMAMWAAYGEPIRLEVAAKAFGAAGVSVDVHSGTLRGEKADAIPLRRERQPPGDVTAGGF
jgi:hypothetical protein